MKHTKLVLVLMLVLLILMMVVPMAYAAAGGKDKTGDVAGDTSTLSGSLELEPVKYTDGIKCLKKACWATW